MGGASGGNVNNNDVASPPSQLVVVAAQRRLEEASRKSVELQKQTQDFQSSISSENRSRVLQPTNTFSRPLSEPFGATQNWNRGSEDDGSSNRRNNGNTKLSEGVQKVTTVSSNQFYDGSNSTVTVPPLEIEKAIQAPKRSQKIEHNDDNAKESLQVFLLQLNAMIAQNNALLENTESKVKEDSHDDEVHERKKRNYIKEMLKNQLNQRTLFCMPLWRHKLLGNPNPPPDFVMKGKAMFRCIVNMIICVFIRPMIAVRERNLRQREGARSDLMRTLNMYIDPTSAWIGKIIRIPVSSLVQDRTLHFSDIFGSKGSARALAIVQLKVRLRTIVLNMLEAEAPPDHIMKLLLTLLDDNNYFEDDFLFACEKSRLETNSVGGTRSMCDVVEESMIEGSKREEYMDPQKYMQVRGRLYRVDRARMLILNFFFIRILISHIVLTPWGHGVAVKPGQKQKKQAIKNQRIVASLLYLIARSLDPQLPPITVVEVKESEPLDTVIGNNFHGVKAHNPLPQLTPLLTCACSFHSTDVKDEPREGSSSSKKESSLQSMTKWIIRRFSKEGDSGSVDINHAYIERVLLEEKKSGFDSMKTLHNLLMPLEYFTSNEADRVLFEEICQDMRVKLVARHKRPHIFTKTLYDICLFIPLFYRINGLVNLS